MKSDPHPRGRASPAEHAPGIGGHPPHSQVVAQFVGELSQPVDFVSEKQHLSCELGVLPEQLEYVAHGHQDCHCTDELCQHRWNWVALVLYVNENLV